jgi:1,4-alpha-glucan branching enzyme
MALSGLDELMMLMEGNHGDPHTILGIHDIEIGKKKYRAVRVFIPGAASVDIIDDRVKDAEPVVYHTELVHNAGLLQKNKKLGAIQKCRTP